MTGLGGDPRMARLRRILWHLLGGTRGGPTRVRILQELRERPWNTNQLAGRLDLDYKTVQHHLRVLEEHDVLVPSGEGYGAVYLPTAAMEESWEDLDGIVEKLVATGSISLADGTGAKDAQGGTTDD